MITLVLINHWCNNSVYYIKGIGEGIVREFGKKFEKFVPCYFEKGVGASIEAVLSRIYVNRLNLPAVPGDCSYM